MESELASKIAEVRKAEDEKARQLEAARQKKEQLLKQALEEAKRAQENAGEEASKLKNQLLLKARQEIEAEAGQITRQAQKEAEKFSAKALPAEAAQRIAKQLLG